MATAAVLLLAACEVPRDAGASQLPSVTSTGCTVPARLAGQDVERLPGTARRMALTFDAGSNADGVPSILRTLRTLRVRATFFLSGRFARTFPRKAARIARRHLVGNHTDTHADATLLTDGELIVQVRKAQRTILGVTGEDPRRFFRFPFGARTSHDVAVLNTLCYVPFRWTVDTLGWEGTSAGKSVATVVDRVLDAASPGAIVLMHVGAHPKDRSTLDADALPEVVRRLRQTGYRLVRLSRVMSEAP